LLTCRQFTSQARVVFCPSATDPSWASNAHRLRPRRAAPAASIRSWAAGRPASTATGSPAVSSAANSASYESISTNFSVAVSGASAVHMGLGHLPDWAGVIVRL